MVPYLGDYNTTETVHIPFNTFTSNDPTASATITDLAAGDIEIHKDGSATQRSSDAGVTVSIDFDSVTGNHMVHIDLSDNTDAGFFTAGSRYQVRVEGTTVDAGTINAWIATFSIGVTLRPTTAGRTLDIQATGEVDSNITMIGGAAQSATDLKDFADTGYDPSTHKVQGVVLTDTCTTNTDMRGTDSAALASVCTETRLSELDAGTAGKMANQIDIIQTDTTTDIPATITAMQGNVTDILADTDELQTNQGDWATATGFSTHSAADVKTAIEAAGSHLTLILEDTGTTIPGLISDLDIVIDRVEADTQDLQTQIGVDGAGLTALPWNASWDAEVQSECYDALNQAIPASPTTASTHDYVKKMKIELVNAKDINADGDSIPYDDAGSALTTVAAAYSLDSTTVKRKKLL
jgi:hypothetical protein